MTPPHVVPSTFYGGNNYTEWTSPVAQVPADRSFFFSPDLVDTRGDSLVATVDPPAGTSPFSTNIIAGPELVTIEGGIEWVGRSQTGMAVVRRVEPGDGPIRSRDRSCGWPRYPVRPMAQSCGADWSRVGCRSPGLPQMALPPAGARPRRSRGASISAKGWLSSGTAVRQVQRLEDKSRVRWRQGRSF